jgi:hypothetical protein
MSRKYKALSIAVVTLIAANGLFSGCSSPCNYPVQGAATIRILNGMPNENVITIFINGKRLVKDYPYDPSVNFVHDGASTEFGYLTSFDDGTPLAGGDSLLIVVTSDGKGTDTLLKQRVSLNLNRQTIIVMGRGHAKPQQPKPPQILRLDDEADQPDPSHTLIRFVDAVPELDSLDVYFKGDTVGVPLGNYVRVHYAEIQHHTVLGSVTGLTVTEAGNPNNVIFTVGYSFPLPNLFLTSVIRGSSKPVGTEYTAAPIVLSDASFGNYLFNFKTFGVRLVNATRVPQLSLLIRGLLDAGPRGNYPNQNTVFNIAADSVSGYLPLRPEYDSIATYWFSKTTSVNDTVASSVDQAFGNSRYSKVAYELKPFGQTSIIGYLNLTDTVTSPPGNFGRVRVVDLSPDHTSISVTLGSRSNVSMNLKQVEYFDVPIGMPSITIKDGAVTKTYQLSVTAVTPVISVYLLPEQSATSSLPIATSGD